MPLVGDGRSGTFSALPGLYGGYKAGVTAAPSGFVVGASRLLTSPTAAGPRPAPEDITGLTLRWRADSIGLAQGAAVSSWPALAGGVALTQATGTAQPAYQTAGVGGQPSVLFDGTTDFLAATISAVTGPLTMFVVVRPTAATPDKEVFNAGLELSILSSTWTAWANANVLGTTATAADTAVTVTYNSTASVVYVNGNTGGTPGGSGTTSLTTAFQMGRHATLARWWAGHIAECLVYNRALTATERGAVHSYIQDRYAITVGDYVAAGDTSVTGTGALTATAATLDGAGTLALTGAGSMSATPATLSGAGTVTRPSIATLTDDFATTDTAKWSYGAAATTTAGQLVLTANPSYTGFIQSLSTYNLTGSALIVELPQVADNGGDTYVSAFVDNPNGNAVLFDITGGLLHFLYRIAGVGTEASPAITYSATAHRWLRLRESAGTLYWDTSPDRSTWTQQASWAPTWAISALFVVLGNGYGGTAPTIPTLFDNFNVAAPTVVSGTGSLSATAAALTGASTLTLTGTGAAASTAATIAGTATVQITGAGSLTTTPATAVGAGSLRLTGTGTATATPATLAASGTATLTGSGALTATPATLSGAGTVAAAGVTGAGQLVATPASLAGTGTLRATGTGQLVSSSHTVASSGLLTLTGAVAATASAATIGGAGTVSAPSDSYHPHVYGNASITYTPATATLSGNGVGTATLTQPSGFGEAFGEAFGGWQTTVTASLPFVPATATLAGDGTSTATLSSNGVGTAMVSEVPALSELQHV